MTFFHPPHQMIFQIGVTLHFWNYQQDNLPDDMITALALSGHLLGGWWLLFTFVCGCCSGPDVQINYWVLASSVVLIATQLVTLAPWHLGNGGRRSVKQNQTRNYGMFSFDRGVCVCEQAGIWLPTNPNFAATCSSPVWSYSPRQTARTSKLR